MFSDISIFSFGFWISLSVIAAIGAQNSYVITQGILKKQIITVVAICCICDFVLIVLGTYGIGAFVAKSGTFKLAISIMGTIFLVWYALKMLYGLRHNQAIEFNTTEGGASTKASKAVITGTLAVSLLNPHVYIDMFILIGGISSVVLFEKKWLFVLGSSMASVVWFSTIATISYTASAFLCKPIPWKIITIANASIILYIAYRIATNIGQ